MAPNKMNSPTAQAVAATCPLCGQPNHCQLASLDLHQGPCWCMQEEIPAELLARVPEALRNRACICRACVEKFRLEKSRSRSRLPASTDRAPSSS